MKRITKLGTTPLLLAFVACGGGDSSEGAPASQAASEPAAQPAAAAAAPSAADWFHIDEASKTVTLDIVAGATTDNNSWNFNGHYNGDATVTVPEGYTVNVNFSNHDANMAHSFGIDERTGNFPPNITNPVPVFEGAITSNPTSLTEATMPGESETLSFVAATAGQYSIICYIPGHAVTGMWMHFTVSSDGSSGVTTM